VVQKETLRVQVGVEIAPHALPRDEAAPIGVSIDWRITTTDGAPPPKLREVRIAINRNGHFDSAGLPVCDVDQIQPATTKRALRNCRSALVGRGHFAATIGLRGQEAYETHGRLLVFNGLLDGKPVLLGQIYTSRPFANSFVITFQLKKVGKGPYGTVLVAEIPRALRSWGNLTAIDMRLARRFRHEGRSHSYLSAACSAPPGLTLALYRLALVSFDFETDQSLGATVTRDCRVRR
jgi:hypothetical protein